MKNDIESIDTEVSITVQHLNECREVLEELDKLGFVMSVSFASEIGPAYEQEIQMCAMWVLSQAMKRASELTAVETVTDLDNVLGEISGGVEGLSSIQEETGKFIAACFLRHGRRFWSRYPDVRLIYISKDWPRFTAGDVSLSEGVL